MKENEAEREARNAESEKVPVWTCECGQSETTRLENGQVVCQACHRPVSEQHGGVE